MRRNGRVFGTSVRGAGRVISTGKTSPQAHAALSAARQAQGQADLRRDEDLDEGLRDRLEMALGGQDDLLLPYQPTPSIDPGRPRTLAAGYDAQSQSLFIRFREGALYRYDSVTPREWQNFKRVKSPGRWINRNPQLSYTRLQ